MASRLGSVVLFARSPRYGRGKRRLAADVGDLAAHRFYRSQLARTVRIVAAEAGWRGYIAVDPLRAALRPGPPFTVGRAARLAIYPQQGRNLGRRMIAAMRTAPAGPVVLIGADVPGVTPGALRRALIACRAADIVFGPAADGGFWLIGSRQPLPLRVFDGVRWSQSTTLDDATKALSRHARVRHVDVLHDVDRAEDMHLRP